MSLKNWKTLYQTDQDWLRVKTDGSEPTIEHVDEIGEYEDEEGFTQKKFILYQFEPEQLKLVRDPGDSRIHYLVPLNYNQSWPHPAKSYDAWFSDNLQHIADSCGRTVEAMVKDLTSSDPIKRAGAYSNIAGYDGYPNFDTEPLEINEPELDKRWS
jgi:hypothetical protein